MKWISGKIREIFQMSDPNRFLRIPEWYPVLAAHTFLTTFVRLRSEAQLLLAGKLADDRAVEEISERIIADLRQPLSSISGPCFISVDTCAPTDTERFAKKGGAVFSAESVLRILRESKKVREAAQAGLVENICIRHYRNITAPREFRLFIHNGELNAMSQYHLNRHYRRLEGVKDQYWETAQQLIEEVAWRLPLKNLIMDIYFTHSGKILILDLNPWGEPTSPLLLNSWGRDWETKAGIVLIPPPKTVKGDVNVSF